MDAAKASASEKDGPPGETALLLVDFINAMDFEGVKDMEAPALDAARAAAELRGAADRLNAPVIYVNDNYGHWHAERSKIIDYCRGRSPAGKALADILSPRDDDYFVIKPQLSGFYATNLPVLLPKLGVRRLVLCGVAAEICVLFTAADAHMRDYDLWVPADCVASSNGDHKAWALDIMAKRLGAETRPTTALRLEDWLTQPHHGES